MRLDRNKNPDGRGKYSIINNRKNTIEHDGFFVIKLQDRFAARALMGYIEGIKHEIDQIRQKASDQGNPILPAALTVDEQYLIVELREYAQEIQDLINKHRTTKIPD